MAFDSSLKRSVQGIQNVGYDLLDNLNMGDWDREIGRGQRRSDSLDRRISRESEKAEDGGFFDEAVDFAGNAVGGMLPSVVGGIGVALTGGSAGVLPAVSAGVLSLLPNVDQANATRRALDPTSDRGISAGDYLLGAAGTGIDMAFGKMLPKALNPATMFDEQIVKGTASKLAKAGNQAEIDAIVTAAKREFKPVVGDRLNNTFNYMGLNALNGVASQATYTAGAFPEDSEAAGKAMQMVIDAGFGSALASAPFGIANSRRIANSHEALNTLNESIPEAQASILADMSADPQAAKAKLDSVVRQKKTFEKVKQEAQQNNDKQLEAKADRQLAAANEQLNTATKQYDDILHSVSRDPNGDAYQTLVNNTQQRVSQLYQQKMNDKMMVARDASATNMDGSLVHDTKMKRLGAKSRNLGHKASTVLIGKPLAKLHDNPIISRNKEASRFLAKIVNQGVESPFVNKAYGGDFTQQVNQYRNKFEQDVQDLHVGTTSKQREEATADFLSDKAETTELGKKYRKAYDGMLNEAKDAGLPTSGKLDNYFNWTMDNKRILNNKDAFVNDMTKGMTGQAKVDAENTLKQYIGKLENQPDHGKLGKIINPDNIKGDLVTLMNSPRSTMGRQANARSLGGFSNERLARWAMEGGVDKKGNTKMPTNKQLVDSLHQYGNEHAHNLMFHKNFGHDGKKLYQDISDVAKSLESDGYKVTKDDVNQILNTVDALNGNYKRLEVREYNDLISGIKKYTSMTLLGTTLLRSFSEIMNVATLSPSAKHGSLDLALHVAKSTYDMMTPVMNRFGKMPLSDRTRELSGAGVSIRNEHSQFSQQIDSSLTNGKLDGSMQTFFKVNMMTYWSRFVRGFAHEQAGRQIDHDIQSVLKQDSDSFNATNRLTQVGIDPADVRFNPSRYTNKSTDSDMPRNVAVARLSRMMSVRPDTSSRPLWQSAQGWVSLLTMFQGYPTMFANTVAKRLYAGSMGGFNPQANWRDTDNGAIAVANIMGAYLMIGITQEVMRNALLGRDEDFSETLLAATSYTGLVAPSWNFPATTVMNTMQYGDLSISPFTSVLERMIGGVGDVATDGDFKQLSRSVPYLSTFMDVMDRD